MSGGWCGAVTALPRRHGGPADTPGPAPALPASRRARPGPRRRGARQTPAPAGDGSFAFAPPFFFKKQQQKTKNPKQQTTKPG